MTRTPPFTGTLLVGPKPLTLRHAADLSSEYPDVVVADVDADAEAVGQLAERTRAAAKRLVVIAERIEDVPDALQRNLAVVHTVTDER